MEFTYGNNEGKVIPVSVDNNGAVFIREGIYKLLKTIEIDLSIARNKDEIKINFDSVAVAYPDNNLTLYIGAVEEDKKMIIKGNVSIDVSADKIFISNDASNGKAQLWFFEKGADINE